MKICAFQVKMLSAFLEGGTSSSILQQLHKLWMSAVIEGSAPRTQHLCLWQQQHTHTLLLTHTKFNQKAHLSIIELVLLICARQSQLVFSAL